MHIQVPASSAGRVIGKGGRTVSAGLGWKKLSWKKAPVRLVASSMAQDGTLNNAGLI